MVAAIIGAIVLVLLIWFLVVGMGDTEVEDGPDMEVPDEIEVDIDAPDPEPDADGGGDAEG